MKSLITWRYFVIPKDKFEEIKEPAEELDGLRNRELSDEEMNRKEELIEEINRISEKIASKTLIFKDDEQSKDGTITEELIYRMDESIEFMEYSSDYYFPFLVYAKPDNLQDQADDIRKIFKTVEGHNLLKKEFLGKWEYLETAKKIFAEIRDMFEFAIEKECGVVKTDSVEWMETEEDVIEEETAEKEE